MEVHNVHERRLVTAAGVGAAIDGLASPGDILWPRDRWPALRLDRPLQVGAAGGHGPIGYVVEAYRPGQSVWFRFTRPPGFVGRHGFEIVRRGHDTVLRHTLTMDARGAARLAWLAVYRPLHDALIEDALATAARALGMDPKWRPWSRYVRILRWALRRARRR